MTRRAVLAGLILALVLAAVPDAPASAQGPGAQYGPYYSGQLLVAKPSMKDPRFAETVIYLAEHDAKGAFGLIVNRPIGAGPIRDFLKGLKMEPVPDGVAGEIMLHLGGPVEQGAGFVLHTNEYQIETTAMIRGAVAVTASLRAVTDIGLGKGPRRHMVLLGYAGWAPGQLESELARGDWDIAPYDEAIVFGEDAAQKWRRARETAGIPM